MKEKNKDRTEEVAGYLNNLNEPFRVDGEGLFSLLGEHRTEWAALVVVKDIDEDLAGNVWELNIQVPSVSHDVRIRFYLGGIDDLVEVIKDGHTVYKALKGERDIG